MGLTQGEARRRGCLRKCAVAALVAFWVSTGYALGQGGGPPTAFEAHAVTQLHQAEAALTGDRSPEATDELRELALATPALTAADRRRARRILSRPPSNEANPSDRNFEAVWSRAATQGRQFYDSPGGQFRIHYVTQTQDAPSLADQSEPAGVPDYVELVAQYADESERVENDQLGWPAPKPDGQKGNEVGEPSARTDIYLSDLDGGLFGYAAPDDESGDCINPPYKCFAYLVLDDDYSEEGYGYNGDPEVPLSVTMAHEYNHVLQFALDTNQDSWMFESTATWAEEKVFPGADDWIVSFMDSWASTPEIPITKTDSARIYGSAVWNHWLDSRYGEGTVLRAWELSRQPSPPDYAAGSYNRAIREATNGTRGFAHTFVRFAAATSEWRGGGGSFPDAGELPRVTRDGALVRRGNAKVLRLDNTTYQLFRVDPGRAREIRLRVTSPQGLQAGMALVGRNGKVVVIRATDISGTGGGVTTLRNAQSFNRITAVVVNADGRVTGPKPLFGEFRYRRDDQRLTARVR